MIAKALKKQVIITSSFFDRNFVILKNKINSKKVLTIITNVCYDMQVAVGR